MSEMDADLHPFIGDEHVSVATTFELYFSGWVCVGRVRAALP